MGVVPLRATEEIFHAKPSSGRALLLAINGHDVGRRWRLAGDMCMGRGRDNDIALASFDVSRRHALLERRTTGWWVRDTHSRFGVFVNDERVTETILRRGDRIRLGGSVELIFTTATESELHEERAERMHALGRLAAGVAHDFNNVLATVMMGIEVLATGQDADADAIATTRQAIEHGRLLAHRLTRFASDQAIPHEPVPVQPLVGEVLQLVKASAPAGITIHSDVEPDWSVRGTRVELLQVLLNLCVNAVDAMDAPGALRVTVRAATEREQRRVGPGVVIEVQDTGTGIPPELLEQIFDPYYTSKGDEGSGIGLSTADTIVRNHQGFIDVESVVDVGTTFRVLLPAQKDTIGQEELFEEPTQQSPMSSLLANAFSKPSPSDAEGPKTGG